MSGLLQRCSMALRNVINTTMQSVYTSGSLACRQDLLPQARTMATLEQMHKVGKAPKKMRKRTATALQGNPFAKGVILKTLVKKPKKPNSANRKCVQVRLSNGNEVVAYVPGEGHNLQEHNIVLVRGGRVQDLPGVKLKCVRGKYDLPHVKK